MAATYCTTADVARVAGLPLASLPTGITEANITSHIEDAEAIIDRICNTTFTSTAVTNEKHDGNDMDTLILRKSPLISLTSLTIQGTSITTSEVYVYTGMEGAGIIKLSLDAEETTFKSTYPQGILVSYTYGYASVPLIVEHATANLAARKLLSQQTGGTYDDLSTFTIGELSGSIGQAYINIRETMNMLNEDWKNNIEPYLPKVPKIA